MSASRPIGDALNTTRKLRREARGAVSPRLHWIDFAKTIAISLVVVYHVTIGMDFLFPTPGGSGSALWTRFNLIAVPLRMPLFFLAAGILAHFAITRPWVAVIRPRIIVLLWPYVLWTIAFACVAGFAYRPDDVLGYGIERLMGLPVARAGYWFLLVLVIFFVVAKLLRRWSLIALSVTLLLALAAPWLEAHVYPELPWLTVYGVTRITRYAFWYFLGCYGYRYLSRIARIKPFVLIAGGGVTFALLTVIGYRTGTAAELVFALSVTGLTAMTGLSLWVSRFDSVRRVSKYMAARSLPIYLIHPMLIVLIVTVTRLVGGADQPNNLLATILVPLVSALAIAASIALYNWIAKGPAVWVFAPPALLDRVQTRRRSSSSELEPSG